MKLQRDIGVSQPTAWFMLHRIRQAWALDDDDQFDGPVEVDETYFGGKRKNMSKAKRKTLTGRGPTDKTAVIGAKDRDTKAVRAKVIEITAVSLSTIVYVGGFASIVAYVGILTGAAG